MYLRYRFRKLTADGLIEIGEERAKKLIENGWSQDWFASKKVEILETGQADMVVEVTCDIRPAKGKYVWQELA